MRLHRASAFVAAAAVGVVAQTTTTGSTCARNLCITATANASTTLYELEYTGTAGWIGIGFGQTMVGSPMVILWANSNGGVTLSQRIASAYSLPVLITDPPRIATLDSSRSDALAAKPKFAFTIPTDPDTATRQSLIWAVGPTNPGSTDPAASFSQHSTMGTAALAITTPVVDGGDTGTPSTGGNNSTAGSDTDDDTPTPQTSFPPLTYSQKLIVAHAILFIIGFLLLLPTGALCARLLRVSTPHWFKSHWIVQFYITAPILIAGLATAVAGVEERGLKHFDSSHKVIGLILCVLYVVQCSLGAFIHFVKDANRTRRPPQNYVHAVVGLVIITIAFAQVRSGYKTEWPSFSGGCELPRAADIIWIVWIVLLPVLYFGGLALLPRQFAREREIADEKRGGAGHSANSSSDRY